MPGPTPPSAPRHATVVAAAPAPEGAHRRRQGGGGGGGGDGHSGIGAEVARGGGGGDLGIGRHVTLADSVVPDGDVVNGSGVDSGAEKPVNPPRLDSNPRGEMTDS